ncbi:pyruvate dehydrogenase E1 component alpha subunit [Thermosporothrix hazakensis]|uniref:Pyruvate dehydrogenase E1 component subunit alpha n=2 Tax=Thermosporothrix TaxID=768650 RepID=A0A326U516_THEHA|nr:pyruvate dehydrogenase (acetyl-transferring) E1 component subunit alpha [Thermosporothrix hazakensis]PZW26398.1 pyruvate dehydrogenase E1 component alpha subunit [Thermosporothrix hazakensis]BBH90600.1 pyruvate dehydrogenase (acetyl-transferring) E1 component subunit alpha [Thermosporothrix sp. COM3]GCE48651.1 pyruvate dehydrogenase (acetyl-transferring) E1 component subunit alpha [Thermosporothrix hazakensis]
MTTRQIDSGMVAYQILNEEGTLVSNMPDLGPAPQEMLLKLYRAMQLGRTFSHKIIALQRQGRATTFGSLVGQEATAVGLAAPLRQEDWLATSYREIASHIWKGIPLPTLIYGFRGFTAAYPPECHTLPIQIVIGTQMLHAVGLAMAAKLSGDPVVAVGVCGDGATSEGDFNEALNFAGVYQAPAVFVVQNNGWAISVPRKKQSAAPSLALRGPGFGIPSVLVDGNDVLAVFEVMKQAVEKARAGDGPTLIETLTYRIGAHTTADDPRRYRDEAEVEAWKAKDPIARLRRFLLAEGMLTEEQDRELVAAVEEEINQAANEALALPPNAPDAFFDWTAATLTPRLQAQRRDAQQYAQE